MPVLWLVIATLLTTLTLTTAPAVERSAGRLRLGLVVTKAVYVAGEPVEARLTLRNDGDAPVRVQFGSGQRFDVVIRRRGALIWRWSYDKAFTQAIQETTVRPGEALTFRAAWDQLDLQGRRVTPGEYEIVGVFLGMGADLSGRLETPPLSVQIRE